LLGPCQVGASLALDLHNDARSAGANFSMDLLVNPRRNTLGCLIRRDMIVQNVKRAYT
jgi:hypothetical protein